MLLLEYTSLPKLIYHQLFEKHCKQFLDIFCSPCNSWKRCSCYLWLLNKDLDSGLCQARKWGCCYPGKQQLLHWACDTLQRSTPRLLIFSYQSVWSFLPHRCIRGVIQYHCHFLFIMSIISIKYQFLFSINVSISLEAVSVYLLV